MIVFVSYNMRTQFYELSNCEHPPHCNQTIAGLQGLEIRGIFFTSSSWHIDFPSPLKKKCFPMLYSVVDHSCEGVR